MRERLQPNVDNSSAQVWEGLGKNTDEEMTLRMELRHWSRFNTVSQMGMSELTKIRSCQDFE